MLRRGVLRGGLRDARSPAHGTEYSEFHQTAEFCGACHDVWYPGNPDLLFLATYTEWKNGPYAAEGIVCQDCHMTPGPGVTKPNPGTVAGGGPAREHINIMTFVGGNAGLGDAIRANENLMAATEMELQVPDVIEPGTSASVGIKITNVGAGHYVPTGVTAMREMWLEVTATTEDGNTQLLGERRFGTVMRDAKGNAPVQLWEATAIHSDDRIPPRESVDSTYDFIMPSSMPSAGAVEIRAALYYRSASEELAAEAGVEIPTTTMDDVIQVVYASEGAREQAMNREEGAQQAAGGGVSGWVIVGALVAAGTIGLVLARKRIWR